MLPRTVIKPVSQGLEWLTQMLQLFAAKQIMIPPDFKDRCLVLERELQNDYSGLVNSVLDFAIESANVDLTIECNNQSTENLLNDWMRNINSSLRGKVPVGINALAKQYYIERWKKSSFIVVRTLWENVEGWKLPTKIWLVDGKNVIIEDDPVTKTLGNESYFLKVTKDKSVELKNSNKEKLFIQRPFETWGAEYPNPYLIQKGVYYNLKFMQLLVERGSNIVAKAIEYLMILKKGDKELAKLNRPEFIYDKKELKEVKESLQAIIDEMRINRGTPIYSTNFDTDVQHLIPDYSKIVNNELYIPIERRIMAGLGFIETIQGITQTRKDSVMNPKVFISEVNSGITDFKSLITDILMTIIEENKDAHKKLVNADMLRVRSSPSKTLYETDEKEFLRSLYDRGLLSKQTLVECTADVAFDEEVDRRKIEQDNGEDESDYPATMYPPIVQNQPSNVNLNQPNGPKADKKVTPDKTGPEKKNYKNR